MTLNWHNKGDDYDLPRYYLLLRKDKLSPIFDHIKNKHQTKVIPVNEYEDMLKLLKRLQEKHLRKK